MKVNVQKFSEEFKLKSFGAKGWKNSPLLSCPHCGKDSSKFGILLLENGGVYKCFRCDKKGSIFSLLRSIDRKDLIVGNNDDFQYKDKLEAILKISNTQEIDLVLPEIKLPVGFKKITSNKYLESRGWTKYDFIKTGVGESYFPQFKGRLIFPITENEIIIGYISRSTRSKEWHDENLKQFKLKKAQIFPRYKNSETQFDKIVGGIDDIVEGETNIVIITEGLFDKINTDRVLDLDKDPFMKCVYTFGCHLSTTQLYKLYEKGVETIILMFDNNTVTQTKSVALNLSKFFNIFISEIPTGKDPGEMNYVEFESSLEKLKTPLEYFINKTEKIILR